MKKWKKTHRQRRRKRMVYVELELQPETVNHLVYLSRKYHITIEKVIHKVLRKAMNEVCIDKSTT